MRVLFLDAYFEPEQIAFTHLEKDLLEGLVQAGHDVEIVCPTPTRGVSKDVVEKYKKVKSEFLYDGRVHVRRFFAPQEGKNPIIRALRYFWCNLRTFQIGRKAKDIDVVFANSTPPTQGLIAGKVAKKLGVPFVYSLQDIFPDSLVSVGMTKEGSLLWRIGRKVEDKTYECASKIITIGDGFRNNLVKKGIEDSKIAVIPNWIDTSDVYDIPRYENKIIMKYRLNPEKFYVCYSGNIGHSQNMDLLMEVAKEIQDQNEHIEFIIIGDGVAKENLSEMIQKNNLNNIRLLPFQPYEDIAHVFSLGDVGLIISKPGIGESSVPSKTWSIMAARRPVIASFDHGELTSLIEDIKCGLIAEAGNRAQLIKCIKQLYENRSDSRLLAKNGYNYVSNVINKKTCVNQYIKEIKERVK